DLRALAAHRRRRPPAARGRRPARAATLPRLAGRSPEPGGWLRGVLLHLLDPARPTNPVPGGPVRGARGARPGGRSGAVSRVRPGGTPAGLRTHGLAGAELEHAGDRLLHATRGTPSRSLAVVSARSGGPRAACRAAELGRLFPHSLSVIVGRPGPFRGTMPASGAGPTLGYT